MGEAPAGDGAVEGVKGKDKGKGKGKDECRISNSRTAEPRKGRKRQRAIRKRRMQNIE
jgi:hypothetical protein